MTLAPLLAARGLKVLHRQRGGWPWRRAVQLRAVDDVNFNLAAGEILGVVGESGCGKSTLARALVGLQRLDAGAITLEGEEYRGGGDAAWRPLRRRVQLVFQDAVASFNPRRTIGASVAEPLAALRPEIARPERERRAAQWLERVGLPADAASRFPHQLSGGQCQRAGIARALIVEPKVLVCDEPVSSLDPPLRAQIIELLLELQREQGLAMIFIAHELPVIERISDRVLVMYLGRIVEQATTGELFAQPSHPYTKALLSGRGPDRIVLPGEPAVATGRLRGCVFQSRCLLADGYECLHETPTLRRVTATHHAACHYVVSNW